jgi:hypothetical protein
VLLPPSARDATRTYMLAQLAARGITGSWTTGIPAVRPARFFTIEELNSASPFVFADLGWLTDTTRLIKALWKVMPSERIVQDVEHAGGPLYDQDPDVPGLHYGQLVSWVTVICAVA